MRRIATAVAATALVASTVAVVAGVVDGGDRAGRLADGRTAPSILGAPDGSVLAAGLETATSCDELGDTMRELAVRHGDLGTGVHRAGVAEGGDVDEAEVPRTLADDGATRDAAATGADGDTTNVQVAGVDEPDLVERVGDLTVVGTQGTLRVVTVDGDGTPTARGELVLGAWSEVELFAVADDRAVAIVRDGAPAVRGVPDEVGAADSARIVPAWSSTSIVLVDLADADAPRALSRIDLEGWLVDARAVDGVVRLAVRGDGPQVDVRLDEREVLPGFDESTATEAQWREWEQAWQQASERRVAEAMARVDGTDWQPHARLTGPDGTSVVEPFVDCDRIALPTSFAGLGTLTLAAIDATGDSLAVDDAMTVVTAGEQLYSTADRVVVATTRWEPCCDVEPVDPVAPGPSVDPFFEEGEDGPAVEDMPTADETPIVEDETPTANDEDPTTDDAAATARVGAVVDLPMPIEPGWWGRGNSTDLHVFDVDGTLVDHVASGNVDGWLLNQFSMSIHEGVLRVATTGVDEDKGRSESAVTTFRVEGSDLVRLGSVGELGPDEDIQAVRFMGEVAYVVTFRRTDPLYVVDLADPTAPRTLGELKIEGYSAYLHPLDQGRLLGVGQDADPATGATRGVQVSTFDVSDPTSPTRLDVDVVPDSTSEVEWDHHALTVAGDGTVLVPFEAWSADGGNGRFGVLVYEVAPDGTLTEVGVLDAGSRWELRPRRTVDLGEVLLTVGEQGVTTWDAATFRPLGQVLFPDPDPRSFEEPLGEG